LCIGDAPYLYNLFLDAGKGGAYAVFTMPRGPRLDTPGALHHVMVRGIEGRPLFRGDADRRDFVDRLAKAVSATGLAVLAWALLPNHVHLLVRTGNRPLSAAMARLLTGYAGGFNRRHRRLGRLFQNRYKSILVEEEPYLLELVRYIHLNPLRANVVRDLAGLDGYPWSGHAVLIGRARHVWQESSEVLAQFGPRVAAARRRYREYLAAGIGLGRRPELQGGGLRRSAGVWEAVRELKRGREHGLADERILGSGAFVESVHRQVQAQRGSRPRPDVSAVWAPLVHRCAEAWGVTVNEILLGSRRRVVAHARAVVAHLAVRYLGLPVIALARTMGVSPSAIQKGLDRGPDLLRMRGLTWERLLPERVLASEERRARK
jgi:putative transposase